MANLHRRTLQIGHKIGRHLGGPGPACGFQLPPCPRPLGSPNVQPTSTISSPQHSPGVRARPLLSVPSVLIIGFTASSCPLLTGMGSQPMRPAGSEWHGHGRLPRGCRLEVEATRPTVLSSAPAQAGKSIHLVLFSIFVPHLLLYITFSSSQSAADEGSALDRLIYTRFTLLPGCYLSHWSWGPNLGAQCLVAEQVYSFAIFLKEARAIVAVLTQTLLEENGILALTISCF